jgi:hypothetical protein
MARDDGAIVGGKPDRLGFRDQIADGENEAVIADDDAVAESLGAENLGSECIIGDFRAQHHHRAQRRCEIESQFVGLGLHVGGECPMIRFGHE